MTLAVENTPMFKALYNGGGGLEKIQTGLTANYVPYWTVVQGLKEAMQNIAYGSIKAGKPAKLYFDQHESMWAIKDNYTGFEKRHLYIGESEQREDEDGLGTFGEGWKIFLLVMARNNINHMVKTVGFDFFGTMEPTPHGTEVLVINIMANKQEKGTKVYANVPEHDWRKATESFAVLQGIDPKYTKENIIIPERKRELWVQGVRIENEDTTNPLKLHYSYNLRQRSLINRDRSHVNMELAYSEIRSLLFKMEEADIGEYVSMALQETEKEDILRGPIVPFFGSGDQKKIWLDVLAELHATTPDKLVIPSYNQAVNGEAKRKGLVLLDTPRKWDFELGYLGIRKADDVIDDRFNVTKEGFSGGTTREDKTVLAKARTKMKKAFGLSSVDQLPQFQYVSEIKNPFNDEIKKVHYEKETGVLYLLTDVLENEIELVKMLIPELIIWKFGATTSDQFERAYTGIIMNLLF